MADEKREVIVTDVKIPFWSMVVLLVKWAIAAIPAVIILFLIGGFMTAALGYIFGTGFHDFHWGSSTKTF